MRAWEEDVRKLETFYTIYFSPHSSSLQETHQTKLPVGRQARNTFSKTAWLHCPRREWQRERKLPFGTYESKLRQNASQIDKQTGKKLLPLNVGLSSAFPFKQAQTTSMTGSPVWAWVEIRSYKKLRRTWHLPSPFPNTFWQMPVGSFRHSQTFSAGPSFWLSETTFFQSKETGQLLKFWEQKILSFRLTFHSAKLTQIHPKENTSVFDEQCCPCNDSGLWYTGVPLTAFESVETTDKPKSHTLHVDLGVKWPLWSRFP